MTDILYIVHFRVAEIRNISEAGYASILKWSAVCWEHTLVRPLEGVILSLYIHLQRPALFSVWDYEQCPEF